MNRDILEQLGYGESMVFTDPDFDSAIIGTTGDGRVVYSYDRMVEQLMHDEQMSQEDAEEFIAFNTVRSLPYIDVGPVIVYNTEEF